MNVSKQKVRVMIADDHAVVRAGLRLLIDSQHDMKVVGEAGDASTALEQARALKPDIVLLDVTMPGGGLKAQKRIAAAVPEVKILILSMHSDPAFVRSALMAGAAGYVTKKAVHTELLSAVRAVCDGKRYVDAAASEGLLPTTKDNRGPVLSEREQQVLYLIASGHSYQQIADRLFLSVKTIETYRARVMEKLELKNRAELVQYAINSGLLGPDD